MLIEIEIKEKNIKLSLKDGKNLKEAVVFADERDSGRKLLPAVDKMLKKSQIMPKDVEKVRVSSDQSDSFTTARIAKAFANSWNWGNKYSSKQH